MHTLPPLLDWATIRQMAAASDRAYKESTVSNDGTDAAGLVYVSGDKIIVSLRGSRNPQDFIQDAKVELVTVGVGKFGVAMVHRGFMEDSTSVLWGIVNQLRAAQVTNPTANIHITGHSLGAAMAEILAYELSKLGFVIRWVITFGKPRVGNKGWQRLYNRTLRCVSVRVSNCNDIVTVVPPWLLHGYRQTGHLLLLLPVTGWTLDPDIVTISAARIYGLLNGLRNLQDVLVREHFIDAYQARIQLL